MLEFWVPLIGEEVALARRSHGEAPDLMPLPVQREGVWQVCMTASEKSGCTPAQAVEMVQWLIAEERAGRGLTASDVRSH